MLTKTLLIHATREIRESIKAYYPASGITKPLSDRILFIATDLYCDRMAEEAEIDIQGLTQEAFRTYSEIEAETEAWINENTTKVAQTCIPDKVISILSEFAENAAEKRGDIKETTYLDYLRETAINLEQAFFYSENNDTEKYIQRNTISEPSPLEKQNLFIASIEPFYINIQNNIDNNIQYKDKITEIAEVIECAQIVLNDYENLIQAASRGENIDSSLEHCFFSFASDLINDSFHEAWELHITKTQAISQTAAIAARTRHSNLNAWKEEAREAAREEWRKGSNLLHNKLAIKLMTRERFKRTPDGKYSKEILLRELAKVTDEPEFKDRKLKYGARPKK